MKVWRNGEKVDYSYEEVCGILGFIPNVGFVKVTTKLRDVGAVVAASLRPYQNEDERAEACKR
nr:hypothetical protein [Schwartzia sp. (in: firmicutes)]